MKNLYINKILILIILISFSTGLFIALITSYSYDNDAYSMLKTFLNIVNNGVYVPSREPGSPIAEIGIGYLAWIGGSKLSNTFSLLLFFLSIVLFPFCFVKKVDFKKYLFFLTLCSTSPLLLFENTHSIDYSWGLVFFVIGAFLKLRNKNDYLSILFFSLSVGSRCIYALYLLPIIFLDLNQDKKSEIKNKFNYLITCSFCCFLPYLPVWFFNSLSFDWLTTASPPYSQGLFGVIARFSYKIINSIGIIQSILIIFFFQRNFLFIKRFEFLRHKHIYGALIIISINLFVFFSIPAEPMYLQIGIISTFFILIFGFEFNKTNKVIISTMILINLFLWFKSINILDITYQSNDPCAPIYAISAKPEFSFGNGKIKSMIEMSNKVKCHYKEFSDINGIDYSQKILKGEKLRSKNIYN